MTAQIVAVVSVVDTREYEEGVDGRMHPVPGSGLEHDCARCGRSHVVWAEVRLDDGTTQIVGTGCARAADMSPELRARLTLAESRAKTLARLMAELRQRESDHAAMCRIRMDVDALTPPKAERVDRLDGFGEVCPMLVMGEAVVRLPTWCDMAERGQSLLLLWQDKQRRSRGYDDRKACAPVTLRQKVTRLGN